jgi:hypothetical protein
MSEPDLWTRSIFTVANLHASIDYYATSSASSWRGNLATMRPS